MANLTNETKIASGAASWGSLGGGGGGRMYTIVPYEFQFYLGCVCYKILGTSPIRTENKGVD